MAERPPRIVLRWEALESGVQAAIALPVLALVLFLLNLGPFSQPLLRSIFYGVFEAIPFTAAIVVATAFERRKRQERTTGE
jgi:hypothetical protein